MKTNLLKKTGLLQKVIAIALFLPIGNLPAQTPVNPGKTIYTYCCSECEDGNSNNQAIPSATAEAGTTGPESLGGVSLGFRAPLPSPTTFSPQSLNIVTNGNVSGDVTFGPPQTGGGLPDTVNTSEICRPVGVPIVTGDGSQVEIRKVSCGGISAERGNTPIAMPLASNSSGGGGISGVSPMSSPIGSGISTTPVPTVNIIKADGSIGRYAQSAGSAGGRTWREGELLQYTSPTGRTINITTADLEVIRPDGVIRQVKTPSGLTDVQYLPNDNQGFVVNYYPASQVGAKDADGFYTFTGTPLRGLKIENLRWQQRQYNELRITKTEGTRSISSNYHYNEGNREWTRTLADGSRVVQRDTWPTEGTPPAQAAGLPAPASGSLNYLIRTKERYDANNTKIATTLSVIWITDANEERLLQEIKDFGGINYAKTMTYYNNTEDEATYGKIKSVVENNGSWEYYSYDAMGRVHKNYRPWLDTTFPASIPTNENGVRVIEYGYSAVTAGDVVPPREERAHSIIERINGIETSRRYNAYFQNTATGERSMADERAAAQGAAFGATGNLRTTITYYSDAANVAIAGRIKTFQNPDNTLIAYSYARDPNSPNSFFTTTRNRGSVSLPNGVALKSLQTIQIEDYLGRLVREESKVYIGGTGYNTLSVSENFYDADGRLIQNKKNGRILYEAEYSNGLLVRNVDEVGIDAVYTYDDMGELVTQTSRGITTTYTRTPGGIGCGCDGSTETTVSAGNLSLTSRVTKDKLGRLSESTDHAGLVTTYAYTNGGRTTTILNPSTSVEIREQYLDGQSKSNTGTSRIAQHYTHGINSDGTKWIKATSVSPNGPRWTKTTNDFLGRSWKQETSAYDGAITTNISLYNNLGQHLSQSHSTSNGNSGLIPAKGTQTTTYSYDELGNAFSVSSQSGNTMFPIVNSSTHYYAQDGGAWYYISKSTLQYVEGGQQKVITTGITKKQLTAFTGQIVARSEDYAEPFDGNDVSVNKTVRAVTVDRTTKTQTVTILLPTSTQPSIQTTTNGILVTATSPSAGGIVLYQYDALGRQTGIKQPRHTNYSNVSYNSQGQVVSTADASGATTTYAYYANGVVGAGQLRQETNALGHTTFHEYDLRGQEIYTWGSASSPVAQGYDAYGQRTMLRTFRDTAADFSSGTFPITATADTTTWIYDEATGVLLQKLFADNKGPVYTYYADGVLKTRTWARKDAANNPLVTTYTYTASGLIEGVNYSDDTPNVSYSYNALGQLTGSSDGTGSRVYSYESNAQALIQESFNGVINGKLHHAYDALNRVTGYLHEEEVPGATSAVRISQAAAKYVYDVNGNLAQIQSDTIAGELAEVSQGLDTTAMTPAVFIYNRLANSTLIASVASETQIAVNSYENNRNILTAKQNKIATGANINAILSQYNYQLNALGQRAARNQSGIAFTTTSSDTFQYNTRGELTSSLNTQNATFNRTHTYDPIGNRTLTTESGVNLNYTTNSLNQYTQISVGQVGGGNVFDDDGNLIADTEGKTYQWDCENRLIRVNLSNGDFVRYLYDSNNRRIRREFQSANEGESTTYFYNGWNVILEKTTSLSNMTTPTIKTHVWGLDLSNTTQKAGGVGGLLATNTRGATPGSILTYAYDGNGNITGLLDKNGSLLAHYYYDSFGNVIEQSGSYAEQNKYRFSTKVWDEKAGLFYYGQRFYSSKLGRWINRDPLSEKGGNNLYRFARNNPISFIDILGLSVTPPSNSLPATGGGGGEGGCTFKVCCRRVLIFGHAHCGIIIEDDGRQYSCSGGPAKDTGGSSGSTSGSSGRNGQRANDMQQVKETPDQQRAKECGGCCGDYGHVVGKCGTQENVEKGKGNFLQEIIDDDLKIEDSECETHPTAKSCGELLDCIKKRMAEFQAECYIYDPTGPNSNTMWYNALRKCTGLDIDPDGFQPGRTDGFEGQKTCSKNSGAVAMP